MELNKSTIAGQRVECFADVEVLRYEVTGFDSLPLQHKLFIYHLSEAALCGRDIIFDQNGLFNLRLRTLLGAMLRYYPGPKHGEEYKALRTYVYRLWFASGIHHHYSNDKFEPAFSPAFFDETIALIRAQGLLYLFGDAELKRLKEIIFEPSRYPKRTYQASAEEAIEQSAVNFYQEGITHRQVEEFYNHQKALADNQERLEPPSYGLNSRLAKRANGRIYEQVYSTKGLYAPALRQIVGHLTEALRYAETKSQRTALESLIDYYNTGDLKAYNRFCIEWVKDTDSRVDYINGFTETYSDPLGLKGSWEGLVHFQDLIGSQRTALLSSHARWFEEHAPIDSRFKKANPVGVSATVVNVAMLSGDAYPPTPIGINLPNAHWIRAQHGSKSVTIENIHYAYDMAAQSSGMDDLFVPDADVRQLLHRYDALTSRLHTDLHECLGHGSGQLLPGVSSDALGVSASTIEEARADLFALYFIADDKMVELGLLPDAEAYKAAYYRFFLNGLITQLVRIKPGDQLEEAHMKNRALISRYVLSRATKDGAMMLDGLRLVIHDYAKVRTYIADLLAEVQRIKSEGDQAAAIRLVADYGVAVDAEQHAQILSLYHTLDIAPYKGFVNPRYELVTDRKGEPTDVRVSYLEGYEEQMQRYDRDYSFLSLEPSHIFEISDCCLNPAPEVMDQVRELRQKLRRSMDGIVSTHMREHGIDYKYNFGLTREYLVRLAGETPHTEALARYLWNSEVRELRIIATMTMPPEAIDYVEATTMAIAAAPHIELREQLCMNLLSHCPDASFWGLSWMMPVKIENFKEVHSEKLELMALVLLSRIAFAGQLKLDDAAIDLLLLRTKELLERSDSPTDTDEAPQPSILQQMAVTLLKRVGERNDQCQSKVRLLIADLQTSASALYREFYQDIIFHLDYVKEPH